MIAEFTKNLLIASIIESASHAFIYFSQCRNYKEIVDLLTRKSPDVNLLWTLLKEFNYKLRTRKCNLPTNEMDPKDLKKNYKELRCIFDKQEKRLRYHVKKAHISTISYLVIQIFILMSISQNSSTIRCKRWWLPFTLSLLVAVIYFILLVETVKRIYMIQYFSDVNMIEQQQLYGQISDMVNQDSSKIDVETGDMMLKPDAFQLLVRKISIGLILVVLIVFTSVILLSCRLVLCDGGY